MPGSISLLPWLLMATMTAIVAGAFLLWCRFRARDELTGILPAIQDGLTPEDAAALGFLCLARYDPGVALPGNDLYPVHGILHFRRLPRDFGALPSNDLKGRLQPVRWVCCLRAVDLYRIVMRLHFERHIAGPLFQMTEREFCDSVRLAATMIPGARILSQSAESAKRSVASACFEAQRRSTR